MIDAVVSGQAGVAIISEGTSLHLISAITHHVSPVGPDFLTPFAGTIDARTLQFDTFEALTEELDRAWTNDRALQLALLLLDRFELTDVRREAADCLGAILGTITAKEFVANILYSAPLPATADVPGARYFCSETGATTADRFLLELHQDQPEIVARCAAWDALSDSLFASFERRTEMRLELIHAGAFRLFAHTCPKQLLPREG